MAAMRREVKNIIKGRLMHCRINTNLLRYRISHDLNENSLFTDGLTPSTSSSKKRTHLFSGVSDNLKALPVVKKYTRYG